MQSRKTNPSNLDPAIYGTLSPPTRLFISVVYGIMLENFKTISPILIESDLGIDGDLFKRNTYDIHVVVLTRENARDWLKRYLSYLDRKIEEAEYTYGEFEISDPELAQLVKQIIENNEDNIQALYNVKYKFVFTSDSIAKFQWNLVDEI
jgi:hypothetical protein